MVGQNAAFEEVGLGKAVETVMSAHIEGVHAPLLQLGSVDKEIDLCKKEVFENLKIGKKEFQDKL